MHNPSHDCKTDHSGFPRMKPIDMSCSKMKTSVKLMTANIETDQTRSHKSKFCPFKSSPVRNRPKPWNFQIVNECAKRNFPDISKLLFHSGHSLTALSSQLLHFSSQLSSASKPSTTTRFGNLTKTYTLGGNLPTQTILWASAANLYNKLPFSSNSRAFIVPCQRYSLGLYFRRIPASAFWR